MDLKEYVKSVVLEVVKENPELFRGVLAEKKVYPQRDEVAKRRGTILLYLSEREQATVGQISEDTGIRECDVRNDLENLLKDKVVTHPEKHLWGLGEAMSDV